MRIGIIGGGPGGAVAAAVLARVGHAVEVFEQEVFPRFHIGESLLPCNMPILEDIGISHATFLAHAYMPKRAAFFEQVGSGRVVRFPFADGLPGDATSIYQVERSRFDQMLLENAVTQGARLVCPATVERVDFAAELPVVHFRQDDREQQREVDFVIDASGRDTLLAKQLGILDCANDLRRAAVFGHVAALPLVPGAERGDIVVSKSRDIGWSWQIPLSDERWSIGLVLKREAVLTGGSPAEVFAKNLGHFPELAARLDGQLPTPVRSIPNISYRIRQRCGRRYALIGDAGGFIDPIFSSGVLLATRAGWRLGKALDEHGPTADFSAWSTATEHDLATFFAFIRLWYDGHFIDNLFFSELRTVPVYQGVISLLAGNTTNPENTFLQMLRSRIQASA
jgi:flavin-dependent dehydrogenase